MVRNFVAGGAGINALARLNGARVIVVDMGVREDLSALVEMGKIIDKRVAHGTANMAAGPAMTREQAVRALEAGITVANDLAGEFDVFGTGEMGIGNTTPGAAIVAALTGVQATEVTGHGTGISEEQRRHKADVIERALAVNRPDPRDGVDVLAKVGGFEIGGIAGLTLGAAAQRKPVVVDGFPATAGAMIAYVLCPTVSSYLIAAHRSAERGHALMQKYLGTAPLLDLHMRLGEGTGAVLAMNLVEAAARVLTEVATFDEASVSKGTP
jgi:nicotinate-nucleotide--dimethylbenzimidazole phosphoribosyltransferase